MSSATRNSNRYSCPSISLKVLVEVRTTPHNVLGDQIASPWGHLGYWMLTTKKISFTQIGMVSSYRIGVTIPSVWLSRVSNWYISWSWTVFNRNSYDAQPWANHLQKGSRSRPGIHLFKLTSQLTHHKIMSHCLSNKKGYLPHGSYPRQSATPKIIGFYSITNPNPS